MLFTLSKQRNALLLAGAMLIGSNVTWAVEQESVDQVTDSTASTSTSLAPGYGNLEYQLPEPGSYHLPVFETAANGIVLNSEGEQSELHKEFADKYVLMGFIYSNCDDINGCPLTAFVFHQLKTAMKNDPVLAERFKLISLSFDPENDTPEKMKLYGNNFKYAGNVGEWKFLTTASQQELKPILEAYNQSVQQEVIDGKTSNKFNHILRVFLIDPKQQVRNIYSAAFLHADSVLNDLRTLLIHENASTTKSFAEHGNDRNKKAISNDYSISNIDKKGYEKKSYTSQTKAVGIGQGKPADLLGIFNTPQLGLPKITAPPSNPISKAKIELGRKLFFDRRLSFNDTFSCAMCHIPQQGFTNNEMAMAVGVEGRSVRRNSPSIYNVAYAKTLFHDGREENLEQQVWGPLLAHNEMGNASVGAVISKIRQISDYKNRFEAIFDGEGPSMETVGMALASYQRTLISANSAFDRWYYGKQNDAISKQAQQGFQLFVGKAGCQSCHRIEKDFALFTDNQLHNTGHGYAKSMGIRPKKQRIYLAPGVYQDVDTSIIDTVAEKPPADLGLYEITQNPHDRWKYKTPSLRNIALSAPYFHDGSFANLEDVVRFYNQGGVSNELLDSRIKPLNLDDKEVEALVAFMHTLTGSNVNTLVSDAFAAPVGDITINDPNWVHDEDLGLK